MIVHCDKLDDFAAKLSAQAQALAGQEVVGRSASAEQRLWEPAMESPAIEVKVANA